MKIIGYVPTCRRRTPTFPSRMATYFDIQNLKWDQGIEPIKTTVGFIRCDHVPGAVVIGNGLCMNLQSGGVYLDDRFLEKAAL